MSLSGETTRLREQDVKIRLLLEHKKEENTVIAIARWESNLPVKSLAADRKRQAEANLRNQKAASREINDIRRRKLVELYAEDDRKHEEELFKMDLTFRKERA